MEWRTIQDPELLGRYEISEYGQIRNKKGAMYTFLSNSGYKMIMFGVNKKLYRKYIHRAVAETFLERDDGRSYVNHKDGERLNNHFSNLEWVTSSENNIHCARVLGRKRHNQSLTLEQAREIRELNKSGMSQSAISRRYGVSKMVISRLINNVQLAYVDN